MDSGDNLSTVTCHLCGEAFSLPEDDSDGNLPRLLLCAHIYCTSCLLSIHCDGVIRCPECEVESTLPEGGVFGLQEDSRIIGLIYTSKMNKKRGDRAKNRRRYTDLHAHTEDVEQPADLEKMKKLVDEALSRGAENLSALQNIHQTLTVGRAEQVKRERARLEMEIKRAADKALQAVQKWKDVQLSQLTHLEGRFSCIQAEVSRVQKREKDLEIAMQMAREVRRVPFLEQYCTLDKVLETLQAPVDEESYDMKGITTDSGMSCVFQSDCLNQTLALSLKMEVGPKQQSANARNGNCLSPKPENPAAASPSSRGSSPPSRSSTSSSTSTSDPGSPDVIVEELLNEEQEKAPGPLAAVPPTGPELANDNARTHRRRSRLFDNNSNRAVHWVVLSHVVNPSNFYVRSVAEEKQSEVLSKKINHFCCRDSCRFTSSDTVETGSLIFVRCEERRWCRANVVEVFQVGCKDAVKTCKAPRLARVRVFLLDSGHGKSLAIQSEEETPESSLKAVNDQLRRVGKGMKAELDCFAHQAIRCTLKDLVPYDPIKGWSKEAQQEFVSVVGSAAVEMRPLGWDRDSLLVDLRKTPMEQASNMPISIREYLVFIEVARFYSPVKLSRRPLLFYAPQYPEIHTELNAVVSHVHSPADFYIQLQVDDMEFALLSAKIQDCYSEARMTEEDDLSIYCPVMQQACVARYEDTLWYRAQVTGHPGRRKVEVQYVDFGNKEIVSVSDLRKIKEEFFAVPSRAVRCCLSDVVPLHGDTWSDACRNRFISLAHQKLVTIVATGKVPKTDPLPVKLFESSLNGPLDNIAELLVNERLAAFRAGLESAPAGEAAVWDPPLEVRVPEAGGGEPGEQPADFLPQLKRLDGLTDLKVRVSHVNSPSSFYVQFAQFSSQLKRMSELVKQCEFMEQPEELVWEADQFCAARINGVWERGRVCSTATATSAEVMRCDHGNKVKLHVNDLRPLPSSLTGSLALECTLTDIRPAGGRSTWSGTACDLFTFYLTGASAVLSIKELTDERPLPVTLSRSNETGQVVSMADFLASKGLGLRKRKPRDAAVPKSKETDGPSPVVETQTDGSDGDKKQIPTVPSVFPLRSPKPAPRTIMTPEKVKTRLYRPPELLGLGPVKITVSAIGEDGVIYTRTQSADCQLEQLKERIQQSMKTLPRQKPYTWKSVQGCAVIGSDLLWYRGQLLEVLGGHVKVQYVDSGLVENIPVVHVYPVLLCDDIPQLCMSCQLHSINPVGGRWQRDAVALMRELLLNRCVDMKVTALPAGPREPLTVELFLDGMSLNRILTHYEHASMDRPASPQKGHSEMTPVLLDEWDIDIENLRNPEEPALGCFIQPSWPQEGEHFHVRVKHLRTPNELYFSPLEGAVEVDGETLDDALTRINHDIGATQQLADFRRGGPCLAQYSDGKFYRAQMNAFSSVEPVRILVQHVDFGSEDPLPVSRLRRMPAELLRFPLQALKVRVAGFKAPSASAQEDVLPYSPGWSRKATLHMLEMLHGNITASIVARAPELTVLLYDEDGELVHLPLVSSGLAELE